MRIVGKKIIRNSNSEIDSNPEINVNPENGDMRINSKAMASLGLKDKDKFVGFTYPNDEDDPRTEEEIRIAIASGEEKIHLWASDPVAEGERELGQKPSDKEGKFKSRYHARELSKLLISKENKSKFKIRVKTDPINIEPHEMTFWEIYIENNSETTKAETEESFVEVEESSIEVALESDSIDSHHSL